MAPGIPNLGNRWKLIISFTLVPLLPPRGELMVLTTAMEIRTLAAAVDGNLRCLVARPAG